MTVDKTEILYWVAGEGAHLCHTAQNIIKRTKKNLQPISGATERSISKPSRLDDADFGLRIDQGFWSPKRRHTIKTETSALVKSGLTILSGGLNCSRSRENILLKTSARSTNTERPLTDLIRMALDLKCCAAPSFGQRLKMERLNASRVIHAGLKKMSMRITKTIPSRWMSSGFAGSIILSATEKRIWELQNGRP